MSRFRGVDACSLVTRSAFADLGQSVTGTAQQEPYDSCSLSLTVAKTAADLQHGKTIGFPDSVSIEDNLQFAALYQVQPKKVTVRGFTVLEGTSPQYGCVRNVQISPEISVSDDTRGAAGIPACRAADDATRSIITTVDDHNEKPYAVPAGALVRQDLCQTLAGPARTLLGGAPTKVMHQLNGCVYIKDKAVLSVFLNGGAWTSEDQPANHTTWGGHDAYGSVAVKNGVGNVYGSLKLGNSPLGGVDSYFLDARVPGVDQSFVAKFNAFAAALHD